MLIYSIHFVCPSFIQQQIFLSPSNELGTLITGRSGVNKELSKWRFHGAQMNWGDPSKREQTIKTQLNTGCQAIPLITKKITSFTVGLSSFWRQVYFISQYCFGQFFRWLKILLVLSGEHKNKKLYNRERCHVNFSVTWDKWTSRSGLFDMSVADRVFGKPYGWIAM